MKRISERADNFPLPWEIDPEEELEFSDFFDLEEERAWAPRAHRTRRPGRHKGGGRRRTRSRWDLDDWDQ